MTEFWGGFFVGVMVTSVLFIALYMILDPEGSRRSLQGGEDHNETPLDKGPERITDDDYLR